MNMINPIQNRLQLLNLNQVSDDKQTETSKDFQQLLQDNLNKVNDLQLNSDQLTEDFALGKTDNIHQVMIAGEKAETAMKLTLAVQNKVIDAYKEIMRLQV
ncbi:MAG TPA: flagellar hook-basal body complex protein FliE [Halanaerobiales bacterium]|nr:flagellar hook-basal body complex protein FliE [Halanaerobiales bacterium]